jgi:hypothetical protein
MWLTNRSNVHFNYRCMSVTFHSTLLKPTDNFALKMLRRGIQIIIIQKHSTCHGLQTDVAVKSGVIAQPIKYSEQGTRDLLCRYGIHSQHWTFSPLQLTKLQKHILITCTLFKCYKNLFKILPTNTITETAAHLCIANHTPSYQTCSLYL